MTERRPSSDLGPVLDGNAKQAYRARLQELHADLDEARSSGNEPAALKVEEELRFLTREIARAVGLFGRDRKTGSDGERARVRVTNSIRFAIARSPNISLCWLPTFKGPFEPVRLAATSLNPPLTSLGTFKCYRRL